MTIEPTIDYNSNRCKSNQYKGEEKKLIELRGEESLDEHLQRENKDNQRILQPPANVLFSSLNSVISGSRAKQLEIWQRSASLIRLIRA